MKYVLLGNGAVAARFLATVTHRPPVLVVLNSPDRQRAAGELRRAADSIGTEVVEWSPAVRDRLMGLVREPDCWLLSVYFAHLLDAELLAAAQGRAVNLHASLLPWCRGANTNVWPLVEHCPAGVTLHVMVPAVDAGAVLAQREVPVRPWDTAASLYSRLEQAALQLLLDEWPDGVLQRWPGVPQQEGGSMHRVRDMAALDSFDLDAHPDARKLYDLLRARSFPPYGGLKLKVDGQVVEARIELKEPAGE